MQPPQHTVRRFRLIILHKIDRAYFFVEFRLVVALVKIATTVGMDGRLYHENPFYVRFGYFHVISPLI